MAAPLPEVLLPVILIVSFALSAACVPGARSFALRCGFADQPGPDHLHQHPTPLLGGLAVVATFLVVSMIAGAPQFRLVLAVVALLVVGLVDDRWPLSAKTKLVMQVIIAASFILAGHGAGHERLTGWLWLDEPLILLWLVTTTNAFNLIDGLDGLAAGIGAIDAVAIAVAAFLAGQTDTAIMGVVLAGALAGFLLYNFYPARIFMGDAGALPVGFLLGLLATHVLTPDRSVLSRCAFPVLVMLVPLLDTAVVSITRLATGKPLSSRAVDHSHHRLLSLGLSQRRAVLVLWTVALLPAIYAVASVLMPRPYLVVTLPMVCIAVAPCLLFMVDLTFESKAPGLVYGGARGMARLILSWGYKRKTAEALVDAVAILSAYFTAILVTHEFVISERMLSVALPGLTWVLFATSPALVVTGTYRRVWQYFGLADLMRVALAVVISAVALLLASLTRLAPFTCTTAVIFTVLLFDLLIATRVSFWSFKKFLRLLAVPGLRVVIVGAGELGEKAVRDLSGRSDPHFQLTGFLDDDGFKRDKLIAGVPVLGTIGDLTEIYRSKKFDEVLIATRKLEEARLALVLSLAKEYRLPVRRYSIQLDELSLPLASSAEEPARSTAQESVGNGAPGNLRAIQFVEGS